MKNSTLGTFVFALAVLGGGACATTTTDARGEGGDPDGEAAPETGESGRGSGEWVHVDAACLVDGDCGPAHHCALGRCTEGCRDDGQCAGGQHCDPHGRCLEAGPGRPPPEEPPPAPGELKLREDTTPLVDPGGEVSVVLVNESPRAQRFRIEANADDVVFDPSVRTIGSGDEATVTVRIDATRLAPEVVQIPIAIHSDAGGGVWYVTVQPDRTGAYRGTISFLEGENLGISDVGFDLEFVDDGTVRGRLVADQSLLWPTDLAVTGTWIDDQVVLDFADVVAAASGAIVGPLAREIGRQLVLRGTFDESGALEGEVEETLSGVVGEHLEVLGRFRIERSGPAIQPSAPAGDRDRPPLPPPSRDFPEAIDQGACDGLGVRYGTVDTNFPDPGQASSVRSCASCAADPKCSVYDATQCATGLKRSASRLATVLPDPGADTIESPDRATWDQCGSEVAIYSDGTTCHDAAALRCAGSLLRRAFLDQSDASDRWQAVFWLDLVALEAVGAGVLASDKMVRAAFAYQEQIGGDVAERELELLERAAAELESPIHAANSVAYLGALESLGRAEVVDKREGRDLHLALQLTLRYAELRTLMARMARRTIPERTGESQRVADVRYLAIWSHVMGAMWRHELEVFRVEDTLDRLSEFGETVIALGQVVRSLAGTHNPFGYPDAYVPMLLDPVLAGQGRSNFEVVYGESVEEVEQYREIAFAAEAAEEEFWTKAWSAQQQRQQLEDSYAERLGALCGADPTSGEPKLDRCGVETGSIAELLRQLEAAHLDVQGARLQLHNGLERIRLEEAAMQEIVENFAATQDLIDAKHEEMWQIRVEGDRRRSVIREAAAREECGMIAEEAALDGMELAGDCIIDAAQAGWWAPAIVGGCAVKAAALTQRSRIACRRRMSQAGVEDAFDEARVTEELDLMVVNQEIDRILRESSLKDRIIESKKIVANMHLDLTEQSLFVQRQEALAEATTIRLRSALEEVAALVARRSRARAVLDGNPDDAGIQPRFLQVRLELGEKVLRWREVAAQRAYLATRALEYEVNRDARTVRERLYRARSPWEFDEIMACLDRSFEDYRLIAGLPQQYVTEISLRDDVLGLGEEVIDEVTGRPIPPEERFQAVLLDPAHRDLDGSVAIPFTLSLGDEALFSRLLCDDRIESLQIQVVGDHIGDGELDVMLIRDGTSSLRRCDGGLARDQAVVAYSLGNRPILVAAGVNDFGDAQPNGGLTAWPVASDGWKLVFPPATSSAANADLELGEVFDVVLRVHHRASTVSSAGAPWVPSCG